MVLFVLFFIVVVVVGVVSYVVGQERVRTSRPLHARTVLPSSATTGISETAGYSLFRAGSRRYWHNVLRVSGTLFRSPTAITRTSYPMKEPEHRVVLQRARLARDADAPGHGLSSQRARCSRREVGRRAGIRFESIAFNDRFNVESSDDAFAVELIDAQIIETLLALDDAYHVVFGPGELIVYAHRKPVAEIGALFDAAIVVMQRIPALVSARTVA